jgi:methionyl-tRNA formyltransferase
MKVAFLGPEESPVLEHLRAVEPTVIAVSDRIDGDWIERERPGFLVSHGYRHILRPDVLEPMEGRAVNLHISLLPWNRGADPNLWSFLEDTPKGVTIHHIDAGVDTGDLVAQRGVAMRDDETLATSYARLTSDIAALFADVWPALRASDAPRTPQVGEGTTHRLADKAPFEHLLEPEGWDTPVARLIGAARRGP